VKGNGKVHLAIKPLSTTVYSCVNALRESNRFILRIVPNTQYTVRKTAEFFSATAGGTHSYNSVSSS